MRSLRLVTRFSVRRSRNRDDVLLSLSRHGRMTRQEIARRTGVTAPRTFAVLHGSGEDYARELSLVALGVVRVVRTRIGVEYELTDRGMFEAATLVEARGAGRTL